MLPRLLAGALLVGLLAVASVTDWRSRRIPNEVVLALLLSGVAVSFALRPTVAAIGASLLAVLIGFAVWIPFYALRTMPAGDVKLFAAGAAWLTPLLVFRAVLYTAIVGGVLALVWLVAESGVKLAMLRLGHLLRRPGIAFDKSLAMPVGRRHIPYGVAMSIGLLATWWVDSPGRS